MTETAAARTLFLMGGLLLLSREVRSLIRRGLSMVLISEVGGKRDGMGFRVAGSCACAKAMKPISGRREVSARKLCRARKTLIFIRTRHLNYFN